MYHLGASPSPLVRGADAQAIVHVREIAAAVEQPDEVVQLHLLDVAHRRIVGKKCAALGMTEDELVERVDDFLALALGQRPQAGKAREIVVADLVERPPAGQLALVEVQAEHEIGAHVGGTPRAS